MGKLMRMLIMRVRNCEHGQGGHQFLTRMLSMFINS
jgi:hypothetical protein